MQYQGQYRPKNSQRVNPTLNYKAYENKHKNMVESSTLAASQTSERQTQFGNTRKFENPSDCLFVFKDVVSDYEEPSSDTEVG